MLLGKEHLWNQLDQCIDKLKNIQDTTCCLLKIWMKLVNNNPEADAQRNFAQSA